MGSAAEALLGIPLRILAVIIFIGLVLITVAWINIPVSKTIELEQVEENTTGLTGFFTSHVLFWGAVMSRLLVAVPILALLVVFLFRKKD